MFWSFKILLKPQVLEKMPQCLKEVVQRFPVQWMEIHNLTLHGTGAVKLVESQFVMRKSWKQEKVDATLVLQVTL